MKRFTFSLQKLLNYKEQVFDNERGILVEMNAVLHTMRHELALLKIEQKRCAEELNSKYKNGVTMLEIVQHKVYLTSLGEAIVLKKDQITLQQQAIDCQTDKVREAKVEISTIEKLKEKKYEEYTHQVQKADELLIEEFVGNQRVAAL